MTRTRIGRICNSPVYKKGNMIISTCFNCKCDVALDSRKITSDNKIICINCRYQWDKMVACYKK